MARTGSRDPARFARPVPGVGGLGVWDLKRGRGGLVCPSPPLPPAEREGRDFVSPPAPQPPGRPCGVVRNGAFSVLVNAAPLLPGQGGGRWSFQTRLVGAGCVFGTTNRTEKTDKAWLDLGASSA